MPEIGEMIHKAAGLFDDADQMNDPESKKALQAAGRALLRNAMNKLNTDEEDE